MVVADGSSRSHGFDMFSSLFYLSAHQVRVTLEVQISVFSPIGAAFALVV